MEASSSDTSATAPAAKMAEAVKRFLIAETSPEEDMKALLVRLPDDAPDLAAPSTSFAKVHITLYYILKVFLW